jgi:serine phosphatase RsbU (regulator of sigma subunit)/integral membrane sensor domain MASE1/anti-sigma regulatory factor (Ser/Thr protein kinase)
VAVAYAAGSQLALLLIEASGLQGVLFIPSGITVAFLLRLPRRLWWVVLLGAGVAEFVMDVTGGFMASQALGFAAANMAEPLVGASIVYAACEAADLARRRDLIWFTIGAVLVGPAVGAAIGAGADRLFGGDDFLITMGQWWLGDALGVILVGSAILVWGSSPDRRAITSVSGMIVITGSVALTRVAFGLSDLPVVFSVLIGVLVAGILFGVRAVSITALAVGLTIAVALGFDSDPVIVGMTPAAALVLIKLQIGLFTLAGLLIAAESHERELATRQAAWAALETEASQTARLQDRELAVRIQRGLLPDRVLNRPGIDISARYEAASDALEVGGDWYDTIPLEEGRLALVVGDMVGHGIDAAISMGRLRTALSALAVHSESPSTLLSELDEVVSRSVGSTYATIFYALVDVGRGTVTYSSAGHPPALLVSPDGQTRWLDRAQTEPVHGRPATRLQANATFDPGSCLVLYSDGLIEQRGQSLAVGLESLEQIAATLADQTPDQICNALFERLTGSSERDDDVVVMVMRPGMDREEYHQVFPARPEELRNLRSSLRAWAETRRLSPEVSDDLLISVGEAASNSIRHAYRDTIGGDVTVRITLVNEHLNISVSDNGKWRDPFDEEAFPGLGTDIIDALSDDLSVDRSGTGTLVTFRIPATAHVAR